MTTHKPLEERVVELEMRLAHHEEAADDLTQMLVRQNRDIEMLTRAFNELRDRMMSSADTGSPSPQDENRRPIIRAQR